MSDTIKNPHDHFLKAILEDAEVAYHFFLKFLPESVSDALDLHTLKSDSTTYINPALKGQFSDTIFNVSIRNTDEQALISILLEHKSAMEKYTAIQVLSYLGLAYQKQTKEKQGIRPIIPMVFYHGKAKWTYKPVTELFDDLPRMLKPFVPEFETIFIDLVRMPDEAIDVIEQLFLRSALITQKYAFDAEALEQQITRIFSTLGQYRERNLFKQLIVYFYNVYEIRGKDPNAIFTKIPEAIKDDFMTLYEYAKKEGWEAGREEGREEGKEAGIQAGREEGRREGREAGRIEGIQEGRQEGRQTGIQEGIRLAVVNGYKNEFTIDQLVEISQLPKHSVEEILRSNGFPL